MTRPGDSPILRRLVMLGAALLAVLGSGCAPPGGQPITAPKDRSRPTTALEAALAADNGLELRRVLVRDGDAVRSLGRFGRDAIDDEYLRQRLERNGIRLRLLAETDSDAALAPLGPPLRDARIWYGQAAQWRELSRRNVGPGLATIVDGRARTFSSGALRLLVRAWTLPMEDGLRLMVELVPHFDPVGAGGYRAMLGHERMRGERFDALMVELHLRPGQALLLTADTPGRTWRTTGAPPTADDPDADPAEERAASDGRLAVSTNDVIDDATERSAARFGPPSGPDWGPGVGPDAAAPLTIGELLLCGEMPAVRNVLLFLPRLPAADAPTGAVADSSRRASRSAETGGSP